MRDLGAPPEEGISRPNSTDIGKPGIKKRDIRGRKIGKRDSVRSNTLLRQHFFYCIQFLKATWRNWTAGEEGEGNWTWGGRGKRDERPDLATLPIL
eukprot:1354139-Amorphochlora_amoeboformis.AAC.2